MAAQTLLRVGALTLAFTRGQQSTQDPAPMPQPASSTTRSWSAGTSISTEGPMLELT